MEVADRESLQHRQITPNGLPIHVVHGGDAERPGILFLHGWPESWAAFEHIMESLRSEFRVAALDLPGIGESTVPPPSNDKRTLARYVRGVIQELDLRDVTLVGHDVGGQIVYAYLRAYPDDLRRAVIMNVAVSGIDPWSEVLRNPFIWHFAFHAVPDLPERLVAGQQAAYFAYFFETISAKSGAVNAHARQVYADAYSRPEALRTGFEWYRAFRQDERDNTQHAAVRTPVLYLRGAAERGLELERYVEGLRASGLTAVEGGIIPDSGHFAPDEQPEAVASSPRAFIRISERQ
jgi:pimeloyl-ACP methyl ester carboxylesterase